MKATLLLLVLLIANFANNSFGQTGPNSPALSVNNASTGTLGWTNPDRAVSSNNLYATQATKGTTNYIFATGFGFAIPSPANVDGIQVDIERSTIGSSNVAILNTWSTGLTKIISAGTNRYLVVYFANENGSGEADLTGLTYGGQAMTQLAEFAAGTTGGFMGRVEAWGLNEAGIAAAGNTTLVPTFAAYTANQYCEMFSSIVLQNVDQVQPVNSFNASGAANANNPHQLGAAIATVNGGMALNGVTAGNGGTYTINSGYTEGTDAIFENAGFVGSGGTLQTASKAITADGTEQPSCTFSIGVNRWMMVALHIQRARELDNQVRIIKGGAITGSNLGATTTAWPTTDAYASYGGSTALWGTTWTLADINSVNFGTALSTIVQNGTAQVDHVRITVWTTSTLPIELLDFTAEKNGTGVDLHWITATETNNDYFIVQRSRDGIEYEDIETVNGAGNSSSVLHYATHDAHPYSGTSYYRIKQVDFDGKFDFTPVRAITFDVTQVLVYPNPATNGTVTIFNHDIQINEVAVYSADMRLVKTVTYSEETSPMVNMQDVADGTYFLMVKTATETTVVKVMKTSIER